MMKKFRITTLTVLLACLFALPAYADVIIDPIRDVSTGTPLDTLLNVLIAAVLIIAAVIVIRIVIKKRKDRNDPDRK